ncbi:MAG: hypothetical protein AB1571_02150 [Nanoarchaeota archaeon]
MKNIFLFILILTIAVLIAGCAQKQTGTTENKDVSDLGSSLDDISSLEKELNITDLNLENDLNLNGL